jgi:hypothetical protein
MPSTSTRTPLKAGLSALVALVIVAACSSGSSSPSLSAPASGSAPVANGSSSPSSSSAAAVGKISANSASQAEIAAALTAAGVPNADRWAREVTEYRPYPADDPTLQVLQDNLAKYNPDPATLAGILSALQP